MDRGDSPGALTVAQPLVLGGRYRVEHMVNNGQFARTSHGRDLHTGARVVVKMTSADRVTAGAALRLEHEAGVLARFKAPELAPLLALGRDGDIAYLVTPFVPGTSLDARLLRGALPLEDALTVARCLLRALAHIHAHDVLHGDVKPANVVVDGEARIERAVLIDFGLARSTALNAAIRDRPVGTARYVSPEQAGMLDSSADERSDLYSAGILLFECLAGHPPFQAETVGELLREHLSAPLPYLRDLGLQIPGALEELVQRLVRKDPRDRYQSAQGVLADLERIAEGVARGRPDPAVVIGQHDRRRTLTEPAFVGRAEDLAVLESSIVAAGQGRGDLVLLEGVSGGGKTRLLDELARRAAMRGMWVLRGQGRDQAAKAPLQLLGGVVDAVVAAAASGPARAAAMSAALGTHVDAVSHALPRLAGILQTQRDVALGPEDFAEGRTLEALTALVHALGSAEQPAVLALDDCQWADDLTMKLLEHWSQHRNGAMRHVAVVVAFRSEEVPDGHVLRSLNPDAQVRLRPFKPGDLQLLVESMAGQVPAGAIEVVHQLSDGNPFMASAVLRGLVEYGALVDAEDGWRLEPQAFGEVQSSQEAAQFLARRLEWLPAATLALLTVGAVLGKDFGVELAADLAGQRPQDAMGALAEARRRHIVWVELEQNRCSFVHDKLRDALLDRLENSERRRLHRLAAQRLEQHSPEALFELAYHFDAAGEHARALPYALTAGAQARAQHALEVAELQYRIAMRGSPQAEVDVRRRTAQELGEVLMLRGRYDEAALRLGEADALAAGDVARAQIAAQLGELAFKRGDVEAGVEALERALHLLGQRVPASKARSVLWLLWEVLIQLLHTAFPRIFVARRRTEATDTALLTVHIYSRLAYAYWFARGKVACAWAHLREMNLAECYPPGPAVAQAYSEHAPVMTVVPWFRRGIAYAQRSLEIRRSAGDAWGEGQSLHFYGVALYGASQYREAMDCCLEAAQLLERTGDRWEVNTANWHVAYCLYRLGDLQGAIEAARAVHCAGVEIGDAQATGISLAVWAKASGGRVPQELIDAELARGTDDVHTAAEVLQAQAVRLIGDARAADAAEVLERAQQLVRAKGLRQEYVAPVSAWLATALREQAATAQDLTPRRKARLLRDAARAARRARRVARSYRNNLPHALRESALIAAMLGRPSVARRRFDRSLAVAAAQSAAWEHAQTLLARGTVGAETGWLDADEDRAVATAAMRALGADTPVEAGDGRSTPRADAAEERGSTLSLADRFDAVLEAGRGIASALTRDSVFAAVHDAVDLLLRGERCVVLEVRDGTGEDVTAVSSELDGALDELCRHLVRQAVATKRAHAAGGLADPEVVREWLSASGTRSALCAPILVRHRVIGSFYVSHSQVSGLFGAEDERLAEFIATLAGAALENAEGFGEVQALTRSLEERVEERTAQLAAANRELAHQAFHDPLTELPNRVLFRDRVEHAIALRRRAATPLAVLLLDLDDFKNVNDTWGHAAGDELLVGAAQRLRACLRPGDTIARLGGDEFAILLEDPQEAGAAATIAERIVRELAPPFSFQDAEVWIHASIGIAVGRGDHDSAEDLFRKADTAMYVAKERGKDRVAVFEPHMLAAVLSRGELRADLHRAIEEHEEHEFVVHYQPILELGSGRMAGVEALVRWNRPGGRQTAPDAFIPLAEEAGFIVPIGGWVLERACEQLAGWHPARPGDPALDLHVNLSPRQLQDAALVANVERVLAMTGLQPQRLVLEITENGLMRDPDAAVLQLRALRGLGVRLALDDFGTGYSSLGYLQRFPINMLKIDKCFMDGMGNGLASSLPRAIVQLGHTLELTVVAEGIERPSQAVELEELGCHLGQGFLWSKALPAHELEQWMIRDRAAAGWTASPPRERDARAGPRR